MLIDSATRRNLPRLSAYCGILPKGLTSYPDAQTLAHFSLLLYQRAPELARIQVPAAIATALKPAWKPTDWIPSTVYAALCALVRDTVWASDDEYHKQNFEMALEMYAAALNAQAMTKKGAGVSVTFMMKDAADKWKHFHQGTTLSVAEQGKTDVLFRLKFPPNLFGDVCLNSLGATFCAAAVAAKAEKATFELESVASESADVRVEWVRGG